MKRIIAASLLLTALSAGCEDTGSVPFHDDTLFAGEGGENEGGSGGGSSTCVSRCREWASDCGYSSSACSSLCTSSASAASCLESYGCSSSAFDDCSNDSNQCETQGSFSDPSCDECMREQCCSEFQECDVNTNCHDIDVCRLDNCDPGSYSSIVSCASDYCYSGGNADQQWERYFSCKYDNCQVCF